MRRPAAELATASSSFSTDCAISLTCSPSSRPSTEISTACPGSRRLRLALSTSLNTVSSKAPDWSEHCTKAKRLPLAEVRSRRSITVPASLMRPGEVEQVLERAVVRPLGGQSPHGVAADALDGSERIADRLLAVGRGLDRELRRRARDVRRQQLHADLLEVAAIAVQLVDVAHV